MSCNEWQKVKLKELTTDGKGHYGIGASAVAYDENLLTYLRITDITDDGRLNKEGLMSVDDDNAEKYLLKKNDIVFARTGNSTGRSYFYEDKHGLLVFAGFLIKFNIDENKVNPRYIKYYTLTNEYKNWVNSFATGSTRKNINANMYGDLELSIPPRNVQDTIVDIIDSLENKIELNNEMNKTLEEMAQSIFKRWFVDFEFPNEDGEPYKSSGGEMVDSELGMIPKGWEVKCIYDLAEYINGTSFKAKDYSEKGLPIIKIAELKNGVTDGTKFFSGEKDKKFYLKNRDILFSWSGNPDTSIDTFIWDKGDAILNQHIFKVIPKFDKGYAFTYLMLKYLKSTFTHIARNKQTTGLGHVTVKDLKELKIALCFSKIKEFNEVAEPIVDLIFENNMNIELLNKTRDSLLPKLMNGEIRVK